MERLGHPEKDKSKRCISSVAENEFSPNSDPTKKGKDFKSSLSNSRMVLRDEEKRKTSSSRTSSKMTEWNMVVVLMHPKLLAISSKITPFSKLYIFQEMTIPCDSTL